MSKKVDSIAKRARMLVRNFSGRRRTGSVLTTCQKEKCAWPICMCVTSSSKTQNQ